MDFEYAHKRELGIHNMVVLEVPLGFTKATVQGKQHNTQMIGKIK
jgi:hypothetical protein